MLTIKHSIFILASILVSISHLPLAQAETVSGSEVDGDVAADVDRLAQLFSGFQKTVVSTAAPEEMIRDYLQTRYQGDRSILSSFAIVTQAPAIAADRSEAGLIEGKVAEREVNREIDRRVREASALPVEKQRLALAQAELARQAISHLLTRQVAFGYDAREQNGCAAATSYLLIFDLKNQRVFGIDLEPCDGE